MNFESLKSRLELVHQWPGPYLFKFIVPIEHHVSLKELLIELVQDANISERSSKNGRYIAISAEATLRSSEEVILIYQRATTIPQLIAL